MIQEEICGGNLEKLKQIPKVKITEEISKKWLSKMEENLQEIDNKIQSNIHSDEIKYTSSFWMEQKKRIEICILYLKKIN